MAQYDNNTGARDCVIVADDADIGRSILRALLRKDFDVIEARNGLDVKNTLEEYNGNIAAILLDIMMPVMSGEEVLQYMDEKGLLERIPVIAVSAMSDAEGKIRCYKAGVADVIEKPYDEKLLLFKVHHVINQFRRITSAIESASNNGGDSDFYEAIIEALPQAIFVIDAKTHRVKYCNERFERLPGVASNPIDSRLRDVVPQDIYQRLTDLADDLIKRHSQHAEIISLPRTQEYFSVVFNAILDDDGEISDLIGSVTNVTREVLASRRV